MYMLMLQVYNIPCGATGRQRKTSDSTASKYGNFSRSLNVGGRQQPVKESISSCAFSCMNGCSNIARMKFVSFEVTLAVSAEVKCQTLSNVRTVSNDAV